MFRIRNFGKPKLKNVVLIEGLPGIGSVGKIAVDFMIESLDAEKFMDVSSDGFPHSVFVNEDNLIDMPKVELYYKKLKNLDLIFVSGEVQPVDERACYEFCNFLLDVFEKYGGAEIISIGGIGLPKIPKNPKLYCTGNNKKIINKYSGKGVSKEIFGTVGPIMGVTGLLVGLAGERNISAIVMLAQTFGHPAYFGIGGAKKILEIFKEKFSLKLKLSQIGKEIKDIEKELISKQKIQAKYQKKGRTIGGKELGTSYIG